MKQLEGTERPVIFGSPHVRLDVLLESMAILQVVVFRCGEGCQLPFVALDPCLACRTVSPTATYFLFGERVASVA